MAKPLALWSILSMCSGTNATRVRGGSILSRSERGWFTSSLAGGGANVSDTAIMWADVARDAVFMLPLQQSSSGVPPAGEWNPYAPGVTICNYTTTPTTSATLLFAPLSALQDSAVRPSGAVGTSGIAWMPWAPSLFNAPVEFLWSSTTLYIAEKQLLFSFSGHTVPSAASNDNCSHVFFSSTACFVPTYRTHMLSLDAGAWVSLSPNATGPGTPSDSFGMPFAAAMGLVLTYDSRYDRVIALGGYLDLGKRPGAQHAALYAFYFANQSWVDLRAAQSGQVPTNDNVGAMTGSFTVLDPTSDRIISYGGLTWQGMFQSGACRVLSLTDLTWTQPMVCNWEMGPWIRGDVVSAATRLGATSAPQQAVMLGGRYTDFSSANLTTFVVPSMWLLDYATLTWSSAAATAFGPAPPLLSPRAAVYADPAWPYGATVLLWGGAQARRAGMYDMWPSFCGTRGGMSSYPDQFVVDTTTFYILRIDADMPLSIAGPSYSLLADSSAILDVVLLLMALTAAAYVYVAALVVRSCIQRRRDRLRVYDAEAVQPMLAERAQFYTVSQDSRRTSVPGALAASVTQAQPVIAATDFIDTDNMFHVNVGRTLLRRDAVEEGTESPGHHRPGHIADASYVGSTSAAAALSTRDHWAESHGSAATAELSPRGVHTPRVADNPSATRPGGPLIDASASVIIEPPSDAAQPEAAPREQLSTTQQCLRHVQRYATVTGLMWFITWVAAVMLLLLSMCFSYGSPADARAGVASAAVAFLCCTAMYIAAGTYGYILVERAGHPLGTAHIHLDTRLLGSMCCGPLASVRPLQRGESVMESHAGSALRRTQGWIMRKGRAEHHVLRDAVADRNSYTYAHASLPSDGISAGIAARLVPTQLLVACCINTLLCIIGVMMVTYASPFSSSEVVVLPTPQVPWSTVTVRDGASATNSYGSAVPTSRLFACVPMALCAVSLLTSVVAFARHRSAMAHGKPSLS